MATPIIIDEYYTRKRINDTVNLLSNLLLSLPVRREREKEPSNDTKHSRKIYVNCLRHIDTSFKQEIRHHMNDCGFECVWHLCAALVVVAVDIIVIARIGFR